MVKDLHSALKTPQAAKYMSVSISTLAKWRMRGEGPKYVKISRKCIVYRIKDLDLYLNDRVCDPVSVEGE